jgi:hypothetical protein
MDLKAEAVVCRSDINSIILEYRLQDFEDHSW